MEGQIVSHYRVLEELGSGGMGVVFKALDTRLKRNVALKFLPGQLTKDHDAKQRFMQEAEAASALDHPNICTIYEIDETSDGRLFIAMAAYEGDTLKERIERGPISVAEAVDIAMQVAQGLTKAHEAGIVHRDIKPANLFITADGIVKILDFGVAKLRGQSDLTRTGTTVGTVAYMAPEQLSGGSFDHRVDIWALGVVLYEMLTGIRPFRGEHDMAVVTSILSDKPGSLAQARNDLPKMLEAIVSRALEKNPDARYRSAIELRQDLAATISPLTTAPPVPDATVVSQAVRRPRVLIPAIAVFLAVATGSVWAWNRVSHARWARETALPEIARLAANDQFAAAYALAEQAKVYIPDDPVLVSLWPTVSAAISIKTTPAAAEVSYREYSSDGPWTALGETPLTNVRLPKGLFQWKIEKAGFEPLLMATPNPSYAFGNIPNAVPLDLTLVEKNNVPPGMVVVPGGDWPVELSGFNFDLWKLPPFLIDRYEVTNRQFKEFVDSGGYSKQEYWRDLTFVRDGHDLSWKEAMAALVDSTGRPGPATWELGHYPDGQDDYPVTGVSWYEAMAYANFRGRVLPTLYHWARAATSGDTVGAIVPESNFSGRGVAPVGSHRAIGPFGTYDGAGNVKEWCSNESNDGRRWLLGGAWNDPPYMATFRYSAPAFDRSSVNGFRTAKYLGDQPLADTLTTPRLIAIPDNRNFTPVSDELFQAFAGEFGYVRAALNERIESTNDNSREFLRQRITFDAGYNNERMVLQLLLPKDAKPPFRTVVFFPGQSAFEHPGPSDKNVLAWPGPEEFVVKSGMALAWPIVDESFERFHGNLGGLTGVELQRGRRARLLHWRQDIGRTIDYLETRKDIVTSNLVYLGFSFGASVGLPVLGLEKRLKVAILVSGGSGGMTQPDVFSLNYAPRIMVPVLMLNGKYDFIFPAETGQKPLFDRLGALTTDKRYVTFDAGHFPLPRNLWIPEALNWLEKYK